MSPPAHTKLLSQHKLQLSVRPVTTSPLRYLLALCPLEVCSLLWECPEMGINSGCCLLPPCFHPQPLCVAFQGDCKEAELLVLLLTAISSGHTAAGLTGSLLIPQPCGICQG